MSKDRNLSIEGLRSIAFLMVMIFHYFYRFAILYVNAEIDGNAMLIKYWGEAGAVIFLIISGYFIIPTADIPRWKYILKRITRLWPAYALAITVCFIITHIIELPGRTVSIKDFFLNLFLVNGFIGSPYVDHAHWYITTLIACTLCISLIFPLKEEKRHQAYWVWLTFTLAIYYIDFSHSTLHLLKSGCFKIIGSEHAPMVIIGASISDLRKNQKSKIPLITIAYALFVKLAVEAGLSSSFYIAIIAIIAFVLAEKRIFKVLEWKPLLSLSKLTYSTYLIHQNIGYLVLYVLLVANGRYCLYSPFIAVAVGLISGIILYDLDIIMQKMINRKLTSRG